MKNLLHILIVIELGAVGWVVTFSAIAFVDFLKLFSGIGMTFRGAMAGFTLHIFDSRFSVLGSAFTGGMARQAG
jgi:hypothetical protein